MIFLLNKFYFVTNNEIMKEVILQRKLSDGSQLKAVFLPEQGMNLASYKKNEIEAIDQSTKEQFEERMGGLGPLIGPHFYHRKPSDIPFVPDETIFPHIARIKSKENIEPFSHGIARYVRWNWNASDTSIEGRLSGMDTYKGVTLAALEGFDFQMKFNAHLSDDGLHIELIVNSESKPSIAGLHYYLATSEGKGSVKMNCEEKYNDMGVWKPIPKDWQEDDPNHLRFDLNEESDYGFRPLSENFSGDALLTTKSHQLKIHYKADSDEHAFQLYHPKGASFVCIEPVTAKNPRDAKQKKNHLRVNLEII